ncbi:hypothetical protein U8D42_24710 [Mycobacterium europaeum]|nr:hypothetical protein [Mycobacterium europaeum]MEA1160937.1 hypothetical protein [Mycobacterium europaeum]
MVVARRHPAVQRPAHGVAVFDDRRYAVVGGEARPGERRRELVVLAGGVARRGW